MVGTTLLIDKYLLLLYLPRVDGMNTESGLFTQARSSWVMVSIPHTLSIVEEASATCIIAFEPFVLSLSPFSTAFVVVVALPTVVLCSLWQFRTAALLLIHRCNPTGPPNRHHMTLSNDDAGPVCERTIFPFHLLPSFFFAPFLQPCVSPVHSIFHIAVS